MERTSQYLNILVSKNIFKYLFFSTIILGSFFVFGVGKASAATYYVDTSCATPGNGTTTVCSGANAPYQTITAAKSARTQVGTIFQIAAGAYGGVQASADSQQYIGNGTVTLTGITPFKNNTVWQNLTVSGNVSYCIDNATTTGTSFIDVFCSGNSRGPTTAAGGSFTWTRGGIKNNTSSSFAGGIIAGTAVFNYTLLEGNFGPMSVPTGGSVTMNNSDWLFNSVIPISVTGGTVNATNILAIGNMWGNGIGSPIYGSSGTYNVSSSLLLPHPLRTVVYGPVGTGVTETGNIYNSDPLFVTPRRTGWISLMVDDAADWTEFKLMADYAVTKGVHATFAATTAGVSGATYAEYVDYVAQGHEIACHTKNHPSLINLSAITMTGKSGSTPTMSISTDVTDPSSANWTGTVLLIEGGSTVKTINLSGTTSINNLVTSIAAQSGWTASLHSGSNAGSLATALANISDQAVASAYVPLFVQQLLFYSEIAESKAALEAGIGGGYVVKTFVAPYNSMTPALGEWLTNAANFTPAGTTPFTIARGDGAGNASYTLSNDLTDSYHAAGKGFYIMELLTTSDTLAATQSTNITALTTALTWLGGYAAIVGHTALQSAWVTVIDALVTTPGISIVLPRDAATTIRSTFDDVSNTACTASATPFSCCNGSGTGTCSGLRFSKTFSNNADFHLLYTSPAIDVGSTAPGLTSDYAGNKIYGLPDIGGYEYQPPHSLTIATPDKINIGAGARIYGDGKFRDVGTTASTTADIKITPSGGTFSESTSPISAWLDISGITNWTNSHKTWLEGNAKAGLTTTDHVIGDLDHNKYYNITVSGIDATAHILGIDSSNQLDPNECKTVGLNRVCKSDINGKIYFRYDGGYSGHEFDMQEGDNTAPTTTATPAGRTSKDSLSVELVCADNGGGSGCNKTYYSIDGANPPTTEYAGTVIGLPDNATTTLRFYSTDNNGNEEALNTETYIIDTVHPDTIIETHPDANTNSDSGSFTFSSDDVTATFECKYDSGDYSACNSPVEFSDFEDGTRTFYVRATDQAGNTDASSSSFTWTIDTQAPALQNLQPDSQIFPVTTTSKTLTLDTTETSTCKYSTTSGTDYSSMTEFENTDATSHSSLITGLNTGTTYHYYLKCQDIAGNQSGESSLSFSIASEEHKISLNSVKVKIERTWNKFKDTIHSKKKKLKLKSEDSQLANGQVKIYADGKRIETIDINSSGAWDYLLKLKDNANKIIKLKFFDSFGTLLGAKKAKVEVDTEDPEFTVFPPENKIVYTAYLRDENRALVYQAKDNQEVDRYRIEFNGKTTDKKPISKDKDKPQSFLVPKETPKGTYNFKVTAYDKAGNKEEKSVEVGVR